jgi:hypothetical protein
MVLGRDGCDLPFGRPKPSHVLQCESGVDFDENAAA